LRIATYVQAPDGAGAAKVPVALEIDGDRVRADEAAGGRKASLELAIVAVARDRPSVVPLQQALDLTLAESDVGWCYLSTPLLTDKTQPAPTRGEPERLVPTARRRFARRGQLFCQYELFSFGGHLLPGVARVQGGYSLRAPDGRLMAAVPPTPIQTDGTRIVRRLAFPLDRLDPGPYELTLTVEDIGRPDVLRSRVLHGGARAGRERACFGRSGQADRALTRSRHGA
jgi:hypothetical protein